MIDDTIMVTVNITNVNEPPVFDSEESSGAYVYVGKAAGAPVIDPNGVFRATDPDGDTLRYNLAGTDGLLFRIDNNGVVTTRAELTTTPDTRSVTVTVQDPRGLEPVDIDGNAIERTVVIAVQPVTAAATNKEPVFPESGTYTFDVPEDTPAGTDIAPAVAATDEDTMDTPTYRLSGGDARHFDINPATGMLITKSMLDYDSSKKVYTFSVIANDGTEDSEHQTVTITVTSVSESPVFDEGLTTARTVPENTAADRNIGRPVTATDSDDVVLTYTLGTTPQDDAFDINRSTGQLKTRGELNYETTPSYSVTVTASDGDNTSPDPMITVTITVTDVNDAPDFTTTDEDDDGRTTRSVDENTSPGEDIGDDGPVTATDPDGDPLTYRLSGVDSAVFHIEAATGQLKTKGPLNHETKGSYSVTVTASDGRLIDTIAVTITVRDINDAPKFRLRRYTPHRKRDSAP